MYDPIEGVHYIFDRYSFLNNLLKDARQPHEVSPACSHDALNKACKIARGLFHSDRVATAAQQIRDHADNITHLIEDCERFLLNKEIKPLYDAKLADFKRDRARMVSVSGAPIVDIYLTNFDVGSLLSDEAPDTSTIESQAAQMTGYDPSEVEKSSAAI